MPDLSKIDARKFLDISLAIEGEAGVQLTQQGEPIQHLVYLVEGDAKVFSGGVEVATVGPGNYIGDVTYLMAEPATATVKLGRAVQIAHQAGNGDTVRLLQKVVDVDDPATGTVRLKRAVDKADEMALDVRSTRTVRVNKQR